MKQWWGCWGKNETSHDERWARAASHLAFRAMSIGGVKVSMELLLGDYLPDHEKFVAGLRGELSSRMGESIESILTSTSPIARRQAGNRTARPATNSTSRRKRRRKFPYCEIIAGRPAMLHRDGSVETLPSMNGGEGRKRFSSVTDYMNWREQRAEHRRPVLSYWGAADAKRKTT